MRIEGIDGDIAASLAACAAYTELKGIQNIIPNSSLSKTDGTRFMDENRWRVQDLEQVIKLLGLSQNKMMVLRLMYRPDLLEIMGLLSRKKLLYGLNFFSKEKLLNLMGHLPKLLLVKMLLRMMKLEDIVKSFPDREIFKILKDPRIEVRHLVKAFAKVNPKYLHMILGKITGQNVDNLKQSEMLDIFSKLRKRTILDGMHMVPFRGLQEIMFHLLQQDLRWLTAMSDFHMFKLFDQHPKQNIIQSFQLLPNDKIMQFLTQLPDAQLMDLAGLVDDGELEAYLLSQQQPLLAYLGGQQAA